MVVVKMTVSENDGVAELSDDDPSEDSPADDLSLLSDMPSSVDSDELLATMDVTLSDDKSWRLARIWRPSIVLGSDDRIKTRSKNTVVDTTEEKAAATVIRAAT